MKTTAAFLILSVFCGLLFSAEIKSVWPLPKPLHQFDKNNDNLLTGDEITEGLLRFDLNGDGVITPSECIFVLSRDNFENERPDYTEPLLATPNGVRDSSQNFKNTILVSVDGFDRAVFRELLEAGRIPAFSHIARSHSEEPFAVNINLTGHQTETKPGHAVMLTGLIPEHSRVQTNSRFLPVPKGLTIHERIKAHNSQIKTVFVSSKRENVGAMTAEELGNRKEKGINIEGGPYLNAKDGIDIFSATDKLPEEAKQVFLDALDKVKDNRFFAFLHFRSPDRQGHDFGRESPEYRKSVREVDSCLDDILQYLEENGISKNTRIIVTADHGFNPDARHHHFAPWITMVTNDASLLTGRTHTLFDIPATVLSGFGVNLDRLDPRPFGDDIGAAKMIPTGFADRESLPMIPESEVGRELRQDFAAVKLLVQDGNFEDAKSRLEEILYDEPRYKDANDMMTRVLENLGEKEEAEKYKAKSSAHWLDVRLLKIVDLENTDTTAMEKSAAAKAASAAPVFTTLYGVATAKFNAGKNYEGNRFMQKAYEALEDFDLPHKAKEAGYPENFMQREMLIAAEICAMMGETEKLKEMTSVSVACTTAADRAIARRHGEKLLAFMDASLQIRQNSENPKAWLKLALNDISAERVRYENLSRAIRLNPSVAELYALRYMASPYTRLSDRRKAEELGHVF